MKKKMDLKYLTFAYLCMEFCILGVWTHQNQQGQQAFGMNQQQHVHGHQPPQHQQQQQQQQHNFQQGQGQGHGHRHGQGHQQGGVFDKSQVQDREHIKEHLEGVVQTDTSKMSEQELQFHYFKMHDSDNNNKLDGCELIKSLIHWHETEEEKPPAAAGENQTEQHRIFKDDELSSMVDSILGQDDKNRDGFIDYLEYMEMLKTPT